MVHRPMQRPRYAEAGEATEETKSLLARKPTKKNNNLQPTYERLLKPQKPHKLYNIGLLLCFVPVLSNGATSPFTFAGCKSQLQSILVAILPHLVCSKSLIFSTCLSRPFTKKKKKTRTSHAMWVAAQRRSRLQVADVVSMSIISAWFGSSESSIDGPNMSKL